MSHLMVAALDLGGVVMTIVGLGALIFFHELGHFLACRLTGTRVEVFSIGFGKELIGWERKGIRYRVSLVPLGGYVKMAAENPGEARSNAPDEFPNKSFSQRLFIMSNGVIFNVLLAFVLFVAAFGLGVPLQTTEVGQVIAGEAAWSAGILPGDVITHADGQEILGFSDLQTEVAFSGEGESLRLTVQRDGEAMELDVQPRYSEARGMPTIGVAPAFEDGAAAVQEDSALAKAGGRVGDVVVALNDEPVSATMSAAEILTRLAGEAKPGTKSIDIVVRVRRADGAGETLPLAVALGERPQLGIRPYQGNVVKAVARGSAAAEIVRIGDTVARVNDIAIADLGLLRELAADAPVASVGIAVHGGAEERRTPARPLTVAEFAASVIGRDPDGSTEVVPRPGMAAARAGMLPGDRITKVAGRDVSTWESVVETVREHGVEPIEITVERPGDGTRTLTITPGRFPKDLGALGYAWAAKRTLVQSAGVGSALRMGWKRTRTFTMSVVLTIRGLVTRRVSARHIGGPIALAHATYTMFDRGWGKYFYILAIISINLAILNMLPIPVLDGGQIVLLCAEKVRGRPLPDRVVGYLQMVGLALILCLFLLAFRNDIVNFF